MKQPFTFTWKQIIYGLAAIGILFLIAAVILFINPKTKGNNAQWGTVIFGIGFVSFAYGLSQEKGSYYRGRSIITGIGAILAGILFFVQSLPRSADSIIESNGDSLRETKHASNQFYKDSITRQDTAARFIPSKDLPHNLTNQ